MILLNWVIDGCEKPMVCLLPFKANTAKQSHGAGRGGGGGGRGGRAGRQADWRLAFTPAPQPKFPSSNQPDTKEAASDNTNSTMIGSDGSQSAAKSGGVIIDCFFLFTSADRRGRGGWLEEDEDGGRGKKITGGQEVFK